MRNHRLVRRFLDVIGAPGEPRSRPAAPFRLTLSIAAGFTAALLFDAATLGFRHITGAPSFPESISDLTVPYIPADTFGRLLNDLGPHSKEVLVAAALVGAGVVVMAVAVAYGFLVSRGWEHIHLAIGLWLLASIGLWALFGPVLDANDAGGSLLMRRAVGILTLTACVGIAVLAAVAIHVLTGRTSPQAGTGPGAATEGVTVSRRAVLGSAAGVGGGLVLGAGGLAAALQSFRGATNLGYEGRGLGTEALTPITANENFYVVSKNLVDPVVDAGRWRLEIKGRVANPVSLTLDDLHALPQHDEVVTLECIANGAGGTLMSTARWSGPRLSDVIARAGATDPTARYVVVSAVDGYYDSLERAEALAPSTLVALRMNGAVLPDRHGFPARIVVPGRYGEKQMKWLSAVELSRDDYEGFYQREGWSESGIVRTFSRINAPLPGARLRTGVPTRVTGLAYAGTRGIARVEVSTDRGATWNDAQLDPEISEYAWRFWQWSWVPASAARYTLTVRATDGAGALQTKDDFNIVPVGASAWHSIDVFAVG